MLPRIDKVFRANNVCMSPWQMGRSQLGKEERGMQRHGVLAELAWFKEQVQKQQGQRAWRRYQGT